MKHDVFQGRKTATIILPDNWNVTVVPMPDSPPITNPEERLSEILKNPIDSPSLCDLLKPGDQIAICVTDISRPSPDKVILPPLLKAIESCGIDKANVTILIATGSHRDVTFDEMNIKYGYYAATNYRILNHHSGDDNNLTDLGSTVHNAPRIINSILTKVDHIMNIGVIDLHQYAGYSGGAKTIAVGCAGEETIQYTHSIDFLEKSGATPGNLSRNIFQETLWDIVDPLPFDFSINLVINEKGEILEMEGGNPKKVFNKMVEKVRPLFEFKTNKKFDIVYMGVPDPKDMNLYQATRAITYQTLTDECAINKDAPINLLCSCPEGLGLGKGEKRFAERMMKSANPMEIVRSMSGSKSLPGEQRAYMLAKAMMDFKINVFGTNIPNKELISMGFNQGPLLPTELMNKEEVNALILKDGMKKVMKYSGLIEDISGEFEEVEDLEEFVEPEELDEFITVKPDYEITAESFDID